MAAVGVLMAACLGPAVATADEVSSGGIAAGGWFSVALDDHGHPWAWGANDVGQLGSGSAEARPIAERVATDWMHAPLRTLAAGWRHVLAIDENGYLWAWGGNESGQLGDGTTEQRSSPVLVDTSGIAEPLGAVVAGGWQSFAIDEGGTLWAWGRNDVGETGTGSPEEMLLRPTPVDAGEMSEPVAAVAAGHHHAVVLTVDGVLWAFGHNASGQLGIGSDESRPTPVRVDVSGMELPVRAVAAGAHFSMAVDDNGAVWVFGATGDLVGETSDRPVQVEAGALGPAAPRAAGGASHATVLDVDGRAHAWGAGWFGQVGDGSFGPRSSPVAVDVTEMAAPLVDVASGQHHTLVRDVDGRVWSWGSSAQGNVGDGFTDNRGVPVLVVAIRERLGPEDVIDQENLVGDVGDLGSDPEAADGAFLVAGDPGEDTQLRVGLAAPDLEAPTTRWQRVRVRVRPSGGGGGTPEVRVAVLSGETTLAETGRLPVGEATVIPLRWDADAIDDPADLGELQVRVRGFASGDPESRTVEVGAMAWDHLVPWPDPEVPPPPTPIPDPGSAVTVETDSALACPAQEAFAVVGVAPRAEDGGPMPPLAPEEVTVDADPPLLIVGETTVRFDEEGLTYQVPVASERCGSREVTVRVAGVALDTRPSLEFLCPPVSAQESFFEASPATVTADGEHAAVATLHLVDTCGRPAFGRPVSAEATAQDLAVALSPTTAVTADVQGGPEDGTAVFALTSLQAGQTGLRIEVEEPPSSVILESPPDLVTFEPDDSSEPDDPPDPEPEPSDLLDLVLTSVVREAAAGQRVTLEVHLESRYEEALDDLVLTLHGDGLTLLPVGGSGDGAAPGAFAVGTLEAHGNRRVILAARVGVGEPVVRAVMRATFAVDGGGAGRVESGPVEIRVTSSIEAPGLTCASTAGGSLEARGGGALAGLLAACLLAAVRWRSRGRRPRRMEAFFRRV